MMVRTRCLSVLAAGFLLSVSVARSQVFTDALNALVGPSNKIYVSGTYTPSGGSGVTANLRLNSDGSIDSSFARDESNAAYAFGVLNDGSVLVNSVTGIKKSSSAGVIDGAFPLDGSFSGQRTLVIDSSGTSFYTGRGKYSANGTLTFSYATSFETLSMALKSSDGSILLGGASGDLVRLNSSGALDSTFTKPAAIGTGSVQGIAIQSDGKIIVTGDGFQNSAVHVLRLNIDGTVDNTFNSTTTTYGPVLVLSDGTSLISNGVNGTNISVDSSGRIVAAGTSLTRLNSDGSLASVQPTLDSSFLASTGVGVYLSLAAIPEPSVYASVIGAIALAAAILIRRRR